MQKGAFYAPNN